MALLYLPHQSISADPKRAAEQNAENARATNQALQRSVLGYYEVVRNYAAQADHTKTINLPLRYKLPVGVIMVNVRASYDPGTSQNTSGVRNFYVSNGTIYVYEPQGLTLNTQYDLTFLVLE